MSTHESRGLETDDSADIIDAGDEGQVLEVEPVRWDGPFTEYDRYGRPTGASYVRCGDCGIEVVTSQKDADVQHREGCMFA